jgi:glycosyltransferase involved in cell wall biosynthesis
MSGLSSESGTPPGTIPLSVIVITRDEEANLAQCLASVAFARELAIVDSGSTDGTLEVARRFGARIEQTSDWAGFGPQKNRALALATQPWVLSLDADERVTPPLREEIVGVVTSDAPRADAWDMPRSSSFCGQFIEHSGWSPDRVLRLVRRGKARFTDDIVHERLVAEGPVAHLRHPLLHISYPDLETVLAKMNRYSTDGARRLAAEGRTGSLASAMLHAFWTFVRMYLLRGGWMDGRLGFVLALSSAEGTFYRYLKLWLARRGAPAQRRVTSGRIPPANSTEKSETNAR